MVLGPKNQTFLAQEGMPSSPASDWQDMVPPLRQQLPSAWFRYLCLQETLRSSLWSGQLEAVRQAGPRSHPRGTPMLGRHSRGVKASLR